MLDFCNLCEFKCNVNRNFSLGKCKCGSSLKVALASVHKWEEPCISGVNGSGSVFFSGCNLNCIFCQNHNISKNNFGKEIFSERLAEIFIELQNKKVHNINLVSPTPYVYGIIEAIKIAKNNGLIIPIVYNTNSYETVETIKLLKDYIDIYLPDIKYFNDDTAIKYSGAPNYFKIATSAILEMISNVGNPIFDENGIMKKGVIVRHLCLPNHLIETKKIVEWINNNISDNVYVSLMAQYFPTYKAKDFKDISRKLSKKEYKYLLEFASTIKNGYIQDLEDFEEEYVPNFNLEGV